ncbi:hypothetical protein [Novosphingobium sp. SG720]|uniref:hypothetical protein n=1 Tax=Novosphingobium sp. SG720 TaxID=2586998 RepID=UPI0014453C4D|nr:hypothetical protein [Novosphingobium sp. SG720]NKJ43258.1 hypothetical protein [Novosphingobium sp. SG720]
MLAAQEAHDRFGGIVLAVATLMNFLLAVLNAHGVGMSNAKVTIVQIVITAVAAGLVYLRPPKLKVGFTWSLFALIGLLLLTSATQGFNAKCFYDMLVIPVFIMAGATLERFPVKILNQLMGVVVAVALVEMFMPSIYTAIANPLNYFTSTRSWIADAASSSGNSGGLYLGAMRAGGSQFSLADHRLGSVFLEPISLGYFALIASFAYNELYKHRPKFRLIAVGVCLFLSLAADSRIPTILILVSTLGTFVVRRPSPNFIWLVPVVIFMIALAFYLIGGSFLFGDLGERIAITFDGMAQTSLPAMLVGGVPESRIGDSGALYLIRCLGLVGAPFAIIAFAGAFSRHKASPAFVNIATAGYITVGALFGGAIFSIKTAALLGMVIGYAGMRPLALPPVEKPTRRRAVARGLQA